MNIYLLIMYDEYSELTQQDPETPRCSIRTFLYRIAFTVFHASLYIERVRYLCIIYIQT